MGISASVRLLLLSCAYPLGNKKSIKDTAEKWRAVLKWAVGIQNVPVR